MKRILNIFLLFILLIISGCVKDDAIRFNNYLDQVFIEFLGDEPSTINSILINPKNYGLDQKKVEVSEYNINTEKLFFDNLKTIKNSLLEFKDQNLNESDQLTKKILIDFIDRELGFERYYYHGTVLGSYLGYQAGLPLSLAEYRFDDLMDVYNYFDYLKTTKDNFKSIVNFELEKLEMGIGLPTIIIDRVIEQCENFLNTEEHFLIPTFNDKIKTMNFSKVIQKQLIEENKRLVNNDFIDAYIYLKEQLIQMKKMSTNNIHYDHETQKYYELSFKKATGVDLEMNEVIVYLDDLLNNLIEKRIENSLDYEIVGSSYDLIDDRSFEELIPFFELEMKNDFPELKVNIEYIVKEIHYSLQEFSSPAMYFISPVDSNVEEVIYINPINFKKTNNYVYQTLAHEAYPGHLYQNAYLKNSDLHNIRKILNYPGYAEGWATYVENYVVKYAGGNEGVREILSFYNSFPYLVLGRLDVGINYQGWGIDESQEYLKKYFNLDSIDVVETYYDMIEVPTNYLKYYFSYYQILDLKKMFKEVAGDDYSDYLFHKIYLDIGPASFDILESEYRKYR